LSQRRVRFTAVAQRHVRRERMWWLENRIHVEVFAGEIEDAVRILRVLPGAGTPYPAAGLSGLRRLYLRKIACHLYFTFDEHDVVVRALWGARRRRAPRIRS
jgi:hypothetical protein